MVGSQVRLSSAPYCLNKEKTKASAQADRGLTVPVKSFHFGIKEKMFWWKAPGGVSLILYVDSKELRADYEKLRGIFLVTR